MPAPQSDQEDCVAHNGSLVPIPGRDVMVQAWYQGGVSVFDWTDPVHPTEIAFFDRGPLDSTQLVLGGSWSAYWYNGVIYSSEITRGLDALELLPSPLLSRNEIDAAKTARLAELNVQGQPKFVWPPTFVLARAYLDQLARSGQLSRERIAGARDALDKSEHGSPQERQKVLGALADQLKSDAGTAGGGSTTQKLVDVVHELAGGSGPQE
jgi:hypothetical protein